MTAAATNEFRPKSSLGESGSPLLGIRNRRGARDLFRLLHRAGALVSSSMNDRGGLASLPMTDGVPARKSAAHAGVPELAGPHQDDAAFAIAFDSSGEALLLLDSSGGIRRANERARELLRLKETDWPTELENFLLSPPAPQMKSFWAKPSALQGLGGLDASLLSGFPIRITLRAILPGSHHLLLCMEEGSPVQIQPKILQTEKMAAVGQLVSGIAHELNNPLTAIMGYAQLLLGHGLAPAQLSEATKVYQEAERARHIVKNLLYFARENRPERSRVDVNEVVERTVALRSYELRVENIAVHCKLDRNLPQTLADPYQLQQVLLNLVINAEQALLEGRGGGHIRIRTSVAHRHRPLGRRILIEISDDGPGIRTEIVSRIFDPFFTTKPEGLGTGLGLSIVYGIVHQHEGEVAFENQLGGGAKFIVELPVVPVPSQRSARLRPERRSRSAPAPRGRIMVVEDERTVAQLMVDVLREEGHYVEAVLSSPEGLTRIARNHYDLVICDLRMPRLDGPAFYDALIRSGSPMRNRILFTTGDTLAPRTVEFVESKGLPFLAKPFLVEELKLAVNRLLIGAKKSQKAGAEKNSARHTQKIQRMSS
jgi:two-component system NtrC family sensor kinase